MSKILLLQKMSILVLALGVSMAVTACMQPMSGRGFNVTNSQEVANPNWSEESSEDSPGKATQSKLSIPAPEAQEIVERGIGTPTVYFISVHNEDAHSCSDDDLQGFHDVSGKKIMDVCKSTHKFCSVQGSCVIHKDRKWTTYNVIKNVKGQVRFAQIKDGCIYGWGVDHICLDPFYSVAADLSIYEPGDVIFIPKLRGQTLPNGQAHDGYVIVRDKGIDVNGKGRFDFYTGSMNWKQASNTFSRLRLNDRTTDVEYQKVTGEVADRVRQKRGYPRLPSQGMVELALETVNTQGVPYL